MEYRFGWALEPDLDRRIERIRTCSDGEGTEGRKFRVHTEEVELAGEVVVAAYPAEWHLEMPLERPLALFEDAIRFEAPTDKAELRCVWQHRERAEGGDPYIYWGLLELMWGAPEAWRPGRPKEGEPPILPAASSLVLGLGSRDSLIADRSSAIDLLSSEDRTPGGPRQLGRALGRRNRHGDDSIPVPSWADEDETSRFLLAGLVERAVEQAEQHNGLMVSPLHPGAVPTITLSLRGTDDRDFLRALTLWEAVDSSGAVCGLGLTPSAMVPVPQGEDGLWSLAPQLDPSGHVPLTGERLDRRGASRIDPGLWAGRPVDTAYVTDDGSESWTSTDLLDLNLLGEITFPSRQIVLADPGADSSAKQLDLRLTSPGPYPVLELELSPPSSDRGLLVLLGKGAPERWVEGPTVDGTDAAPGIDTGRVAILDRDARDWLRTLHQRPADRVRQLGGAATLLSTDTARGPDIASLTAIGGDVPIWVSIGMDAAGDPVALLVESCELAALGGRQIVENS